MRERTVPSLPTVPRLERYSGCEVKWWLAQESSLTTWLAEKRLVSLSPEPFFITYEPRGMPTSCSRKSSMASTPLGQEPGTPLPAAPRHFTSCSAMKLEEVLFILRTARSSGSLSWLKRTLASAGVTACLRRPRNLMPRALSSSRKVAPK
jgi:hypothetical protein